MKHEDDMTTNSHTRDTAGEGRGFFSNTHGDVLMSILQHRHTANTSSTTTTTTTHKKDDAAAATKKKNGN